VHLATDTSFTHGAPGNRHKLYSWCTWQQTQALFMVHLATDTSFIHGAPGNRHNLNLRHVFFFSAFFIFNKVHVHLATDKSSLYKLLPMTDRNWFKINQY